MGAALVGANTSDPDPAEMGWIANNVELAAGIAAAYGIDVTPLSRPELDEVWTRWMAGETLGIEDPNLFISAFGLAFGSDLATRLDLAWKVIEAEHVSRWACTPSAATSVCLPADLVA